MRGHYLARESLSKIREEIQELCQDELNKQMEEICEKLRQKAEEMPQLLKTLESYKDIIKSMSFDKRKRRD